MYRCESGGGGKGLVEGPLKNEWSTCWEEMRDSSARAALAKGQPRRGVRTESSL